MDDNAEITVTARDGLPKDELTNEICTTVQPSSPSAPAGRGRWLLLWTGRFAEFALVQCWVQLCTAMAGMILVRSLSKHEYSLYAIANSMQSTAVTLAELGIGMGVRSIGGRVWHDRERFGQLLHTAFTLRHTFAAVSIVVSLPIAFWMLRSNGADWWTTLLLCAIILAGILPLLKSSVLRVVPELHGEYRRIQKLEFGNSIFRVVAIGLLALTRINAALATSVAAAINWMTLLFLGRWGRQHANLDSPTNADDRRELWRLSIRLLPNTLFFCLQGQITLLILTLVGNPIGIADVTALSRLSALLMVFSAAFGSVLVPRFARCQDPERLPRLYLGLVGATMLGIVPVLLAGWFTPQPLLWLLGGKYSGLENALGWAVSTACVVQVAGAMNQLNFAKSWIQVGSLYYAPLTIVVQVVVLTQLDVSHLHGVLVFGFISSLTPLPTVIADAYLGLSRAKATIS